MKMPPNEHGAPKLSGSGSTLQKQDLTLRPRDPKCQTLWTQCRSMQLLWGCSCMVWDCGAGPGLPKLILLGFLDLSRDYSSSTFEFKTFYNLLAYGWNIIIFIKLTHTSYMLGISCFFKRISFTSHLLKIAWRVLQKSRFLIMRCLMAGWSKGLRIDNPDTWN